ncbi:hypothetical protein [Bradyrhizobium liaoningense]|uniref:hypothetical protein n=1 Tax=Bradyrhizobium liaoningense TaxID=43992 RepID=UPI001BAD063C|nr:hypothetical protein [Bradyrhizobium liaoningense]MBR0713788.1 hypothetical protein [Bradyrhizobium liaoningense]
MSRGQQLEELVSDLSLAVERARRLGLLTTVYLLSMALVEVREAAEADNGDDDDGTA